MVSDTSSACQDLPSAELLKAVSEFNRGDWFECHETLEDLWVGSTGEMRDFYQGLLMIAVALHHWRKGNYKGSMILLNKGADLLRRVRPVCQRIDVVSAVTATAKFKETLTAVGPERMEEIAPRLIPRLQVAAS